MATVLNVKKDVLKSGVHVRTSSFGMRTLNGVTKMHNGIDLVSNSMKNGNGYSTTDYIVAFADGKVVGVLNNVEGKTPSTGNYVKIQHEGGEVTVYYHLKTGSVKVSVGDNVKAGQVIGFMGSTGNSTGAHLHFGIKINNSWVDPQPYLLGEKELSKGEVKKVNVSLPVLKKGSKGEAVKTLQRLLNALGYKGSNNKALDVDGSFGGNTQHAFGSFQESNGLQKDYSCGKASWTKILNG